MHEMTAKPDCVRCQRIKSAIEHGLSRDAAREANGWDECSRDECPMLRGHTASKLTAAVASAVPRRQPAVQTRGASLALTPVSSKGEPCPRNNNTLIGNFSAMSWSCCDASASLAATRRRACRLFDVPGSFACQLAAI
jgi:hypothetical protein